MTYSQFLKKNKIQEEKLTYEDIWKLAQRQLVADYIKYFTKECFCFEELDEIIRKINVRT